MSGAGTSASTSREDGRAHRYGPLIHCTALAHDASCWDSCDCDSQIRSAAPLPRPIHFVMSAASPLKQLNSWKVVGGYVKKYLHQSTATKTDMKFSIFFPPSLSPAAAGSPPAAKVPAVYWLSGLTCTDDNFMQKAGAFQAAAAANVAIICPDTSPRGANLGPEEKASWSVAAAD